MKLLNIEGENKSLDAILMVVPDEYDKKEVYAISDDLIEDPTIAVEIDLDHDRESDFYLYHPYMG